MGNYFSQVVGWFASGSDANQIAAFVDEGPRTRSEGAAASAKHGRSGEATERLGNSFASARRVSAPLENATKKLEEDLAVLKIVRDQFMALEQPNRHIIEVLGLVQRTMGTFDRNHAPQGITPEGADEHREIRRRFDNTQIAFDLRRLHSDLMAAHRETREAYENYRANPDDDNARNAWRDASDREAVANGNYVNYGNGTPLWREALQYGAATAANFQAYDPKADGLVGLRDLLHDYEDDVVNEDELFQGINDLVGRLERQLASNERGLEPDGTPPMRTSDVFALATERINRAIDPPGRILEDREASAIDRIVSQENRGRSAQDQI